MWKSCHCGQTMKLGFRFVISKNGVKLKRVPVYECEVGCSYMLHPAIKDDMKQFLLTLNQTNKKINYEIDFTEMNEFAAVLWELYESWDEDSTESFEIAFEHRCEERINLLLDLYGYAKSSKDEEWMETLTKRLSQLSKYVNNMFFTGVN